VSKHRSLRFPSRKKRDVVRFATEDLQDVRSKLSIRTNAVTLFLGSLSVTSLGRIEHKLDKIAQELQRGERDDVATSIAISDDESDPKAHRHWRDLRKELVQDGFSTEDVDTHKSWIKTQLRERILSIPEFSVRNVGKEAANVLLPSAEVTEDLQPMTHGITERVVDLEYPSLIGDRELPVSIDAEFKKLSTKPARSQPFPDACNPLNPQDIDAVKVEEESVPKRSSLRRSPSISSIHSVHSEVSEHDIYGNVTKRTITTTTYYSTSVTDVSASDAESAFRKRNQKSKGGRSPKDTRPAPRLSLHCAVVPRELAGAKTPDRFDAQFATKCL
jgi:hypothetical protein